MSQSDFSSRTATSGRPRVFLADLEYAKKEEWERRRKLRLKQVRQQARDIASIIRNQASHAKKKKDDQIKCVQYESAVKSTENQKVELQQKLTECLTSVGTGHSTAAIMTEVDELLQHKLELQDTLARVRAELALEKAKETRKLRQEVVECPREGISISKVKSIKPLLRAPNIRKMSPPRMSTSRTVPATPPNFIKTSGSSVQSEEPPGDPDSAVQLPTEKTIFSPPMLTQKRSDRKKKLDSEIPIDGRKSCPPTTESTDVLDSSVDSDDSGQTWPPVSVRKKKNTKVRMYDHSAKKCSEYVQQCGIIRMESPISINMKDLIHEEEELLSKKAEEQLENRQLEVQRGLKALREEMAKQDFDTAIKDLCQTSKERRFRKAHNYQPSTENNPILNKERRVSSNKADTLQAQGAQLVQNGQSSQHRPPVSVANEPFQSVVTKLAEEREAILLEQSSRSDDSTATSLEDSEDEATRLPLWVQAEVSAQNNWSNDVADRVATPETVMGNINNAQKETRDVDTNNVSSDLSSFIRHEREFEQSETTSPSSKSKNGKSASKSNSQGGQSTSNGTNVSQSSSSAGINVKIKIRRGKAPVKQLSFQTPNKETETSSSYYSPPEKLSPQQLSVLSDILSKMSVKNRNPVLHHYITRMLEMSHQSLSDLDVSVCSDFSIQSELFSQSKASSPRSCNTVKNKQPVDTGKPRVCLKELDNLSTAGTVCSSPRSNSVGNVSTTNHSGKIAALLRNIIELQRIYNGHSSSDPSLTRLSESHSSYHSVPNVIDAKHCQDVAPLTGNGINYCEDTGIFINHQNTSQRAEHPTLASLLNGQYFNIPSQLFPNPFAAPGVDGDVDLDQLSTFHGFNMLSDVPDGYSRKPERDPSSIRITTRDANKVINTLSDIESVVSSIQSTPTKKAPRATSPARSLPEMEGGSSLLSEISSGEFISSQEMQNNDLINTTSSTSDFEDVFRSLGLGWALTTLRRTRTSRNLRAEDSSSKSGSLQSSEKSKSGTGYHHSTPLKDPNSIATQGSPECDPVPSLTPPDIALHCPNWQK